MVNKDGWTIEQLRSQANKLGKKNKYGNIKENGFDSRKENRRWNDLFLMMQAGEISGLLTQVPFTIEVKGMKVCKYIADFTYTEKGEYIVEDTKGKRTSIYQLKKKLMLAVHGIKIRET